jgi:Fur family transcriptional regulator, ferric uptake regulator
MTHHLLNYPERLRREGFRVTPQRKQMLDAICALGKHASTDKIITTIQKRNPDLNRATIYRNLIFLRERHLLVSAEIGGEQVFEIAKLEPHHHLVCNRCSQVTELAHEDIAALFEVIKNKTGFQADADHITLTGICSPCQRRISKIGSTA